MAPFKVERRNYQKVMGGQRDPYTRQTATGPVEVVPPAYAGCPLHKAIRDAAISELEQNGVFQIDDVLENKCIVNGVKVDLSSVDVQWDFIMRSITEDDSLWGNDEFIALTKTYFSPKEQKRREQALIRGDVQATQKIVGRMVGSISSGKVAGFAVIEHRNADLVLVRLGRLERMTKATGTALYNSTKQAVNSGVVQIGQDGKPGLPASAPQLTDESN